MISSSGEIFYSAAPEWELEIGDAVKAAEMKRMRKRWSRSMFEDRMAKAAVRIQREIALELARREYEQKRRELNQELRELCNLLAERTSFERGRIVNPRWRSQWKIVPLFRLRTHDYREYCLTDHGHLVYDLWGTRTEHNTLTKQEKLEGGWSTWRKVRTGNPYVTNKQMMTLIRKVKQLLEE